MPTKMLLSFTEQEYASIPSPKTTWAKKVILEALGRFRYDGFGVRMEEYAFELRDGGVVTAWGVNKMAAIVGTGLMTEKEAAEGGVVRHGTVDEAREQGWLSKKRRGAGDDYPVVSQAEKRPTRKRVSSKDDDGSSDGRYDGSNSRPLQAEEEGLLPTPSPTIGPQFNPITGRAEEAPGEENLFS